VWADIHFTVPQTFALYLIKYQFVAGEGLGMMTSKGTLLMGVMMIALVAGEARAQDTAQPESEGSRRLDDIVVTARKRTERLQDVPMSATAMSGEQLQRQEVNSLQDLVRAVPGISYFGFDPGRSKLSIRGIGTTTVYPTTGFFLDDVPIGNALLGGLIGQFEPLIFDLDRVEILKGPQGTLYGGSAMGGAIKYVTKKPSFDRFGGVVGGKISLTDEGAPSYEARFVVNVPIVDDRLAGRLAVEFREDGGYIDRVAKGRFQTFTNGLSGITRNTQAVDNVNRFQTLGVNAALRFAPTDTLTITPTLYFQRSKLKDQSQFWPFLPGLKQSYELARPGDDETIMPILTIEKQIGDVQLVSITSYLRRTQSTVNDFYILQNLRDPRFVNYPSPSFGNGKSTSTTQELRASYAPAGSNLSAVAGVYAQRETSFYRQSVEVTGYGSTGFSVPDDVVFLGITSYTTRQLALFGDVTYAIDPRLDISVGLRKFWIDQDYDRYANGLFNGGLLANQGDARYGGLNPKFAINFKATPDNMVYASASKGFRPGGVVTAVPGARCAGDLAALGLTTTPSSYGPDNLWNYEIGMKNDFERLGLRVNGALFYIDWKKIQQSTALPNCGFSYTDNVGSAVSKGAELEIRFVPAKGLTLGSSAVYNHAEITESRPGTPAQVGDPVLYTPRWSYKLDAEYDFPIGAHRGFVRADYQWNGKQFMRFNRTAATPAGLVPHPQVYQPGFGQLNLTAGYDFDAWSAKLFVKNVTNNRPLLNLQVGYDAAIAQTLRPFTIGIGLDRRF
jgi:iron complex outermembrane receptor protein